MGKIIYRTALASVVLFLSALLFVFNVFALFLPSLSAKIFDGCGAGRLAVSFSRNVFECSKDINDAALLIERAVKFNDNEILIKYIPVLKSFPYYNDFLQFKDRQEVSAFSDYRSYIDGNYLIALYCEKQYQKCIDAVKEHLNCGYQAGSPVRFLVRRLSAEGIDFEEFTALLKSKYGEENITLNEKINLCVDIYSIYLGAEDSENALFWKNEYARLKNS
jgi:hypothetical protein